MNDGRQKTEISKRLDTPADTDRLAALFADQAAPGLVLLLEGPVGAGKTYFARSLIQTLMRRHSALEDVPSPTFTLVQTYQLDDLEIWHADLYRITSADELIELGLDAAFETAMCLVEWPDRLGDVKVRNSVRLSFSHTDDPDARDVRIEAPAHLLEPLFEALN